jgi:hypothetical protein
VRGDDNLLEIWNPGEKIGIHMKRLDYKELVLIGLQVTIVLTVCKELQVRRLDSR